MIEITMPRILYNPGCMDSLVFECFEKYPLLIEFGHEQKIRR
jgi:hypothetical protein